MRLWEQMQYMRNAAQVILFNEGDMLQTWGSRPSRS